MQTTTEPRYRRRIPCSLSIDGRQHSAMVLNVSRGGLFARTTASARRGDPVVVDLSLEGAPEPIALEAQVVWRRVAHSAVSTVSEGGLGLRFASTAPAYEDFLRTLSSNGEGLDIETGQSDEALEFTEVAECAEFEVRVKLRGSPRSRSLRLRADDEETARRIGLDSAGEGWELLEVHRRRS